MSSFVKHVFVSAATIEFADLRDRIQQKWENDRKRYFVRRQPFSHKGVKTLFDLHDEITRSNIVLHVIGGEPGAIPPMELVREFLNANSGFESKYPDVVASALEGRVSYTHWEAWIALHLDNKRLCRYRVTDFLPLQEATPTPSEAHSIQHEHLQRLMKYDRLHFKDVENRIRLEDAIDHTLDNLAEWKLADVNPENEFRAALRTNWNQKWMEVGTRPPTATEGRS